MPEQSWCKPSVSKHSRIRLSSHFPVCASMDIVHQSSGVIIVCVHIYIYIYIYIGLHQDCPGIHESIIIKLLAVQLEENNFHQFQVRFLLGLELLQGLLRVNRKAEKDA